MLVLPATLPEPKSADFALKQPLVDLLDKLARLEDGSLVRIDFRRGLPFLLETKAPAKQLYGQPR
jgi:hypothetical protein